MKVPSSKMLGMLEETRSQNILTLFEFCVHQWIHCKGEHPIDFSEEFTFMFAGLYQLRMNKIDCIHWSGTNRDVLDAKGRLSKKGTAPKTWDECLNDQTSTIFEEIHEIMAKRLVLYYKIFKTLTTLFCCYEPDVCWLYRYQKILNSSQKCLDCFFRPAWSQTRAPRLYQRSYRVYLIDKIWSMVRRLHPSDNGKYSDDRLKKDQWVILVFWTCDAIIDRPKLYSKSTSDPWLDVAFLSGDADKQLPGHPKSLHISNEFL